MKIFAVVNNYLERLGTEPTAGESIFGGGETAWYEMPDSAVTHTPNPVFVPDTDSDVRLFPSIVYKICRLGKGIAPRFAGRYLGEETLGVAMVCAGRLLRLRRGGMPWTSAVAFDRSCILGNFTAIGTLKECGPVTLTVGSGEFTYDAGALRHTADEAVAMLSAENTLKTGDLIFAALTPDGIPAKTGARLTARLNTPDITLIDLNLK
ncbi:MAG: hypothetical protein NC204_06345 [Candidatus Amulumruptor caecigallinarius]|nr:hypothetical protein [Candidatus Amulumruptor caecigallinarius]